ncbi:unnamed protein product [Brassicogethes aeneus]|uniref:c-Myc-binding protein n=1 Tax=Brassicogethes aeneus TaxID=1431903 RepID=A0A9P0B272_BRAAE|nr:unnamed protein product [Brassicogethes aeneus]
MNTANQNFKPSEGKREEFRKYLEKNGVMDALTKVLVNLYEEVDKPEDALGFIRDKLALQAGLETYDQMTEKQQAQETKIQELEEQVAQLAGPPPEEEVPEVVEEGQPPPPEGEEVAPAPVEAAPEGEAAAPPAPEAEAPPPTEAPPPAEAPPPTEEAPAEPAAAPEAPPEAPPA